MNLFADKSSDAMLSRALLHSLRLWSDPWEAPEVPDPQTLQLYLDAPTQLPPFLRKQIGNSFNCQRALDLLRADSEQPDSPEEVEWSGIFDSIATAMSGRPENAVRVTVESQSKVDFIDSWAVGDIVSTQSLVEHWDGDQMSQRQTYKPCVVLLKRRCGDHPWNDTVFRAVPCSPLDFWPGSCRCEDETLLDLGPHGRWVAHNWLEYPVSAAQLAQRVCSMSFQEIENAPAFPFNPDLDEPDAPGRLERERLLAIASFLGSTAHARRLQWEATQDRDLSQAAGTLLTFPRLNAALHEFRLAAESSFDERGQDTASSPVHDEFFFARESARLVCYLSACRTKVTLMAYDNDGEPSDNLDGILLCDAHGQTLASIHKGCAEISAAVLAAGLSLRRPDGQPLQ